MGRSPQHRSAIVEAAIALFRERGYAATGIAEILQKSGAPKGSLYYYFPDGKEAVGAEAVRVAGLTVERTLAQLSEQHASSVAFLKVYTGLLGDWMAMSGYRQGCPIATTLLETTPESEPITQAGQTALKTWLAQVARVFENDGIPQRRAARLATLTIAAVEGGMLLARVEQSTAPLDLVAREIGALLRPGGSGRSRHS